MLTTSTFLLKTLCLHFFVGLPSCLCNKPDKTAYIQTLNYQHTQMIAIRGDLVSQVNTPTVDLHLGWETSHKMSQRESHGAPLVESNRPNVTDSMMLTSNIAQETKDHEAHPPRRSPLPRSSCLHGDTEQHILTEGISHLQDSVSALPPPIGL